MFPMAIRSGDTIRVAYQRKMSVTKAEAEATLAQMKETLPKQLIGACTVIVNYEMEYREKDLDLAI